MSVNRITSESGGYEWQLNSNEITCDGSVVCELKWIGFPDTVGYWQIKGDDEYRFSSQLSAFYFVIDRCV